MITIDGSQGEGGGQILRSSLALSIATNQPFRIHNIRAGREKPGLMRQHLTCVQAAATISSAEVTGATIGSTEVTFSPGQVTPGNYYFPIGTAGSTTMVLQAILPALLITNAPSTIRVEGGTHNKAAPPFDFFDRALIPLLNRMGPTITARMERHGFYPAGGGRLVVDVQPAPPQPFELLERGQPLARSARALVARLPYDIAKRELATIRERLGFPEEHTHVHGIDTSLGPGNAVIIEMQYQHVTEVFSSVGELGKSAEFVARQACDEAREYIAAERPVGQHLADQLMVPLAVLAGGRYATGRLTEHSRTNLDTIAAFGGRSSLKKDEGIVEIYPLRS